MQHPRPDCSHLWSTRAACQLTSGPDGRPETSTLRKRGRPATLMGPAQTEAGCSYSYNSYNYSSNQLRLCTERPPPHQLHPGASTLWGVHSISSLRLPGLPPTEDGAAGTRAALSWCGPENRPLFQRAAVGGVGGGHHPHV